MTHISSDRIAALVDELCSLDPALAKQKDHLTSVVTMMIEKQPEWKPDSTFVHSLKKQLGAADKKPTFFSSFFAHPYMNSHKTLVYGGLAGTLCIVLVMTAVLITRGGGTYITQQPSSRFAMVSPEAFGALSGNNAPSQAEAAQMVSSQSFRSSDAQTTDVPGYGGGMQAAPAANPVDKISILPYPIEQITYEYIGDEITLPASEELPVYQYRVSTEDAKRIADQLKSFDLPMNLGSFENLQTDYLQFSEKKERGYTLNMNFQTGQNYISLNYNSWPELRCENGCEYRELTDADLPSDVDLITKANQFLAERGIDMSIYGEPVVPKYWLEWRGEGTTYVPNVVQVIYPLMFPEGSMHEFSGTPGGLSVSINIEHEFVDGVSNIHTGSFVGSAYALESNTKRILDFAKNGGRPFTPWYAGQEVEIKQVQYQLGTPEVIYVQHSAPTDFIKRLYPYSEAPHDMYVPALRFPVLGEKQGDSYKPQYVVIPLVSDILDTYEEQNNGRPIPTEPVPLPGPEIMIQKETETVVSPDNQMHTQ